MSLGRGGLQPPEPTAGVVGGGDVAGTPLDLCVRSGMRGFGRPLLDVETGAGRLEGMTAQEQPSARIALLSSGVQPSHVGSVECVPLSVGTTSITEA